MPVRLRNHLLPFLMLLVGAACYGTAVNNLRDIPRAPLDERLRLVMPAYVQVILAGGDRYLASNLGMVRAITLSATVRDATSYAIQAKIQQQASILNPYNEDNGYLAAAILPWEDQVEIAQWILNRSTQFRDWDPEPAFYQGFNEYHFNKNNERAAELAVIASDRAEGVNKRFFRVTASKWLAKKEDKELAIQLLKILRETTTDEDIKKQLGDRIIQTEGLHKIQTAMELYKVINGRPTWNLNKLVHEGYLIMLPRDPFNYGYGVNEEGEVVVRRPVREQK